uniref:Interleukin 17C n=1 Tax=Anolis carolinensis TaxID=28377 RepID=A0A803SRU1_ANOCA
GSDSERSLLLLFVLLGWTEARRLSGGQHRHHSHCIRADDLQDGEVPTVFRSRTARWADHPAVQLVPVLESEQSGRRRHRRHHHKPGCPNLKLVNTLTADVNERSISPWKYTIKEDANRIPRQLAFAECLCNGCIDGKTGQETTELNSVLVEQNMMVLKRKPCRHPEDDVEGFVFETTSIKVPVACACALARS